MEKKITKKEMFTMIKEVEGVASNPDMVSFIDHEIELLNNRNSNKKPTKTQIENEDLKEIVLGTLNAEGMTASEVLASSLDFSGMSNQKISSLLNALVKEEKVVKFKDKKRTLFKIA
jgi:hypothetical protein